MSPSDRLAGELRRAGMFPALRQLPYLRSLVRLRGSVEISNLRIEVASSDWIQGVSLLSASNRDQAVIRACGLGALLTEFLVAPLRLNSMQAARAASLGARVNLIVSLYDNYVDQGHNGSDVLPVDERDGKIPLLSTLVRGYYERVADFPAATMLGKAIGRMRAAEDRVSCREFSPLLWRRKCALPWVVMGMGGWMAGHRRADVSHLAWLYRLGIFFGWIDDAADVSRDSMQGRVNRIRGATPPEVDRIARSGRRLLRWWDQRCAPHDCREAFRYCVNSWIDSRPK